MMLMDILKRTAAEHPNNEAVVYKSMRLPYQALYQKACRLSFQLLQRGVRPGDRVVVLLQNSPNYLISYFGILGSGAVVVALNPDTTSHELKYLLTDCAPKGIICDLSILPILEPVIDGSGLPEFILVQGQPPETKPRNTTLEPLADILDDVVDPGEISVIQHDADVAQIIYTSGTTGKPKGVMLTHGSLLANTKSIVTYLQLSDRDRVLVILPFFYSYGNSLLLTHVFVGGTLVISEQFVFLNQVIAQMLQEQVTGFSGVPSSYAMLLRKSAFPRTRFEHLRYVTCAGGALSKSALSDLRNCLPAAEIYVMYGQFYSDVLFAPRICASDRRHTKARVHRRQQ